MRLRIFFGVWLLGILFPTVFLRRFSTPFRQLFDTLLNPEWVHIILHFFLFFGLGILLVALWNLKPTRQGILMLSCAIIATGILQELFQVFSQNVTISQLALLRMALFDLAVDLGSGLLGASAIFAWQKKNRPLNSLMKYR